MRQRWFTIPNVEVFGAPVSVHWSVFLLLIPIVLMVLSNPTSGLITGLSYFLIITIHELGHAFVASNQGCRVIEIRIGAFHGQCRYESAVNEYKNLLVAWGGVAAQLLTAIPLITIGSIFGDAKLGVFWPVVPILGYFNLFIALFNLLPVRGMDGYKAWRIVPYLLRKD